MKKFRSKKGLTLVELVVTVAILGVVSSMGVGIVANSITNYSKASVTSAEHQTALDIEGFIVDSARRSIGVDTLTSPFTIPQASTAACYVYFNDKGYLRTVSSYIDDPEAEPTVIADNYKGVKSVSFDIRKQKLEREDTTSESRFVYVEYTIELERGYKLTGSTVMGNIEHDYMMDTLDEEAFCDSNTTVTITRDGNKAFVFKQ